MKPRTARDGAAPAAPRNASRRWRAARLAAAAALFAAALPPRALAGRAKAQQQQQQQDDDVDHQGGDVTVNYVYAAQLGFGGYRVGGLSVEVYTLPLAYTLPEAVAGWDLTLYLPLQYGHYHFKTNFNGLELTASADTLAAIPGVGLEIPLLPGWTLSPYGEWGFGTPLEGGQTAYIYGVGVSSLYEWPWRSFRLGLGTGFSYAGNKEFHGGQGEAFGDVKNGVEARHPLGFTVKHLTPDAGVFFVEHHFLPDAKFSRFDQPPLTVVDQYEFGLSFGSSTPIGLWFLEGQRIGVSYRFGDGLNAVRMNLGFPF
jgi:hypothetical protein